MERQIINGICSQDLTNEAFTTLYKNLVKWGNKPCQAHQDALKEVLSCYTAIAQGLLNGRYCFPLSTGLGKSSSIVAWITALESFQYGTSIAVCASRVESLCELYEKLLEAKVPKEKIGLWHSLTYDKAKAKEGIKGYAAYPKTEDYQNKQYLLISHARVRGGKGDIREYYVYRGKPRDGFLWDESLLVSDNVTIKFKNVKDAVMYFNSYSEDSLGIDNKAAKYLMECYQIFLQELADQRSDRREAKPLHLPDLGAQELLDFIHSVPKNEVTAPLVDLLDSCQNPMRVAIAPSNQAVIWYDIVVPQEFRPLVVLDASHVIRRLSQLDKDLLEIGKLSGNIVSYERVKIHQLFHPSGRHTMEKEFSPRKKQHKISQEIAQVIHQIPKDEAILIFTFTQQGRRGMNLTKILQADLRKWGIKLDAKVKRNENGKERRLFGQMLRQSIGKLLFNICSHIKKKEKERELELQVQAEQLYG